VNCPKGDFAPQRVPFASNCPHRQNKEPRRLLPGRRHRQLAGVRRLCPPFSTGGGAPRGAATTAARDDARRLLLSAVTFAYLQAQLAQENIAIARADEAFNQRLLVEARLRYDVGAGPLSDTLNFQVRGNTAQSRRIQEERIYQAGLISLASLLGVLPRPIAGPCALGPLDPTSPSELAAPQIADWCRRPWIVGLTCARATIWYARPRPGSKPPGPATIHHRPIGSLRGERPGDMGSKGTISATASA
jgi:hypothetical protein